MLQVPGPHALPSLESARYQFWGYWQARIVEFLYYSRQDLFPRLVNHLSSSPLALTGKMYPKETE